MSSSAFESFTGKYKLSKTLRFALRPQGKTLPFIQERGLISVDEARALEYKKAKETIDDYHRYFIEEVLSGYAFDSDKLLKGYELFKSVRKGNAEAKPELDQLKEKLCKEIGKAFAEKNKTYSAFGKTKELLKGGKKQEATIISWLEKQDIPDKAERIKTLRGFSDFTTYFTGFDQNRENVYSGEAKHTSVGYRVACENLMRHFENCLAAEQHAAVLKPLLGSAFDLFTPAAFSGLVSQKQITGYNQAIGSQSDLKTAEKGINQKINEHRQKQNLKPRELPLMKELYKQILSDREDGFRMDVFENDSDCIAAVKTFARTRKEEFRLLGSCAEKYFVPGAGDEIGLVANALQAVSHGLFEDFQVIRDAVANYAETHFSTKKDKEQFQKREVFSAGLLGDVLAEYGRETDRVAIPSDGLFGYARFFREGLELVEKTAEGLDALGETLEKGAARRGNVEALKLFLDSGIEFVRRFRPFVLRNGFKPIECAETGTPFYLEFEKLYDSCAEIFHLYDKVRNYVVKKPYSADKVKINFDCSTLLDGWDRNKENDNLGVILLRGGKYYLGIIGRGERLDFSGMADGGSDGYAKMVYKLFPGASKMIVKCTVALNRVKDHFESGEGDCVLSTDVFAEPLKISRRIYDLCSQVYDKETGKLVAKTEEDKRPKCFQSGFLAESKDEKTYRAALADWIDFCKEFLSKYNSTKDYSFAFRKSSDYKDLQDFYSEVDAATYRITFENIPRETVDRLVDEGKLYLFQIYSKDFSDYAKGKPNLHTLYWRAIFEPENLENPVVRLNGGAEIFWRKASLTRNETARHRADEPIDNKNPLNPKRQSTFKYELVKDRRFTEDQFVFHCPLCINAGFGDESYFFNRDVLKKLKNNPGVNIIGLDRGERNLLYYSVIGQDGRIIEQKSLNVLESDQHHRVDYHGLLGQKAGERDEARRDWKTIENIKELKAGYLSHIVHKLTTLMIEHNAVVVLEDLNFGFKRGRFQFESQVYQKFEKALIDKLNCLVFKDAEPGTAGHYLRPYQLTAPFESFEKMGKQTGFLFYVPAAGTSKIDPVTGFVNTLHPKYENEEKSRTFFKQFDAIRYNPSAGYFEFGYTIPDVAKKEGEFELLRKKWTVCSFGPERYIHRRIKNTRSFDCVKVDVTAELKKLLSERTIRFEDGADLRDAICKQEGKDFYARLLWCLDILLMVRYSGVVDGQEFDYILSPVQDKSGGFFDSRKSKALESPCDADANGAYNIARKGLYLLKNISEDLKLPRLSKNEWLNFCQQEQ